MRADFIIVSARRLVLKYIRLLFVVSDNDLIKATAGGGCAT